MDSLKYEINDRVHIRECHTNFGTKIYIANNNSGKELGEINLFEGVNLASFLKQLEAKYVKEKEQSKQKDL